MSNPNGNAGKGDQEKKRTSHGNDSVAETPKDVTPQDATSRDITQRKIASSDADEKQQALVDESIELSFPASDPPAVGGGITRVEVPKKK